MSITAVIPAVDEPDIYVTIESLLSQTVVPDRIIVAVNNTNSSVTADSVRFGAVKTENIKGYSRVEVVNLGHIEGKKAGALNSIILPLLTEPSHDFFMVVDADTVVSPVFVEEAMKEFDNPRVGAVGGVFYGHRPKGWLQWCQSLEYARYAHEIERTQRVMVLTGTASIIRKAALYEVVLARDNNSLPGEYVYDMSAITEDNELTLALKTCGWTLASPKECKTYTELMGTVKDLQKQRIRWYRGALDNLKSYGLTKVTKRYWFQQFMLTLSTITFFIYLGLMATDLIIGVAGLSLWWSLVGLGFSLSQAITVRSEGPKAMLFAALLLPEMVYNVLLQVAYARGVRQHLKGSMPDWHQATGVRSAVTATGK